MTNEEKYETWAPHGGRWSPWVKPVLFACMGNESWSAASYSEITIDSLPSASENVALVFDLPCADGVWAGLVAAKMGYRPVPLYNAVPQPTSVFASNWMSNAIVNVVPIVDSLRHATDSLRQVNLPPDAPPAFLLDANHRGADSFLIPGRFDNRSLSFTTDFPSAILLTAHGIRRVVLIQSSDSPPQADLGHTLRRWQEGGITIEIKSRDRFGPPVPIQVQKPSGFGMLWQRALAMVGLRRHGLGGFGGIVPEPSSAG